MAGLGPRGALLLVCAMLVALIGRDGGAAAIGSRDVAFAPGLCLQLHVPALRGCARPQGMLHLGMQVQGEKGARPEVFFDSHAKPSHEPRIGSLALIAGEVSNESRLRPLELTRAARRAAAGAAPTTSPTD